MSDLNLNLLADIYGVHQAFLFGQSQRTDYPLSNFIGDITRSRHLDDNTRSTLIASIEQNENCFALSFYPIYLVKDSFFDAMACHFAVSSVVNEISKRPMDTECLHIRSVVVPSAICSRYDADKMYEPSIESMEQYLEKASNLHFKITRSINMKQSDVSDTASLILDMISRCKSDSNQKQKNIVIVFNRQKMESDTHTLTVFECSDLSALVELKMNYFISFDFQITGDECLVRCWLTFGIGQRLRWYPEYAVWIIPTLFVRSETMKTYKVMQAMYDDDYKHGWRVTLDDKVFNKYYHIITGFEHVSNNYHRSENAQNARFDKSCEQILLRDYLMRNNENNGLKHRANGDRQLDRRAAAILREYHEENEYDSDAIKYDMINDKKHFDAADSNIASLMISKRANLRDLKFMILEFENLECKDSDVHHVDDCKYIDAVVRNLQKFEECHENFDDSGTVMFETKELQIVNGQQVTFLHDDVWQSGTVSQVLNDGICISSEVGDIWIKMEEIGRRIRSDFKSKNVVIEQVLTGNDSVIDASNIFEFDLEPIINGFDHIIEVHKFFSDEQRKQEIQKYIAERVECERGEECPMLTRHSDRARERDNVEEKKDAPVDEVDALIEVTADTLDSIHCYLVHKEDHLYRLRSRRNEDLPVRFTTESDEAQLNTEQQPNTEQQSGPRALNYGLNILKWLPFGRKPLYDSLKPEIINNPKSTVDEQLFTHFLIICIAKINGKKYTEQEMMCLKLYSDTTELQALLRRAHWTGMPLNVRQAYYHWAMGLYRTHLYHAQPVPTASTSSTKPCKLFHGLDTMFLVSNELPMYNGPFSTTIAKDVAKTFCKARGLLFMIQSSYENPLRFCIGIEMISISCFKNEQEVLLYNEHLPIQKTETFDDDPKILIDHLLFSLKDRETAINKISSFYNQLGVRFEDEWIPTIMEHELLLKATKYGEMRIIDRLWEELKITFFGMVIAVREGSIIDENNNLVVCVSDEAQRMNMEQFIFTSGYGADVETNPSEFTLNGSKQMIIPSESEKRNLSNSWTFNLFCEPTDDSYGITKIHSVILPLCIFPGSTPLNIAEVITAPMFGIDGRTRDFCVRSFSSVRVTRDATINGAVSICIISNGEFFNQGTIRCHGFKKNIFIICDVFNNMQGGIVECTAEGTVHVFARKYKNEGTVNPEPMVTLSNPSKTVKATKNLPVSIVDFLMHILRSERSTIDNNWLYNNFGFQVESSWYQLIVDHPALFEPLKNSKEKRDETQYRIINRLANEMDIKFFQSRYQHASRYGLLISRWTEIQTLICRICAHFFLCFCIRHGR